LDFGDVFEKRNRKRKRKRREKRELGREERENISN